MSCIKKDVCITHTCSNCNKKIKCQLTDKTQMCSECGAEFALELNINWIE